MNIDSLLQHAPALPSMPRLIQDLIVSLDRDPVLTDDLVSRIATDQALSAKLLRLANSKYYEAPRTVGTVDAALRLLGRMTVRTLVLSTSMTGQFKSLPGFDLKGFWRYSVHTATASKYIATYLGLDGDLAFTIGLMHAVGRPVMHSGLRIELLRIDESEPMTGPNRIAAERAAFGFSYEDVGAELVSRWNFPPQFRAAIVGMAVPLHLVPVDRLQGALHIGCWRARLNGEERRELESSWPAAIGQAIGLKQAVVLDAMPPLADLSAGLDDLIAA